MYDMYPAPTEWGPSRRDPDSPSSREFLQRAFDRRDAEGPRPDDN